MAFNGSGLFVRLYNWVNDRDASINIDAPRMDAEMDGMATGLSNCITKDGQTTPTANIPMNSNKFTGLAAGSSNGDSVRYEQLPVVLFTNKSSNTSRASTTTVTDDPDLSSTLEASSKYLVEVFMNVSIDNTPSASGIGFRLNYTDTLARQGSSYWYGLNSDANGIHQAFILDNSTATINFSIGARIVVSGFLETNSSGTFSVQWAQRTSSVDATILESGSYMVIRKVG